MAETKTGAAATSEGTDAGKPGEQKPAEQKPAEQKPDQKPAEKPADKPAEKTEGKAGTEPGDKAAETKVEAKVPEKYALKVPDAGAALVDDADLKHLEEVARASGWTNDDAQAALEEHLALIQAQADRYLTDTKSDKEYGGEKFDETKRLANRVVDRIRPAGHARRESFLRFMGRGGAGNQIEVLSFLADLGKLMSEDAPGHTRASASGNADVATTLYDHPTSRALDKTA
jgi:hypothetical protein